ncbi:MAG: hypothetical protein ACLQU4_02175 [Limisphaerales bacterium]
MKRNTFLILLFFLAAGCTRHDARLLGTWHSNRDATVAAAFQRDPRWTNAPPDKVARFRDMFGRLTITYGKNTIKAEGVGESGSFPYRVVESGSNYVVIEDDEPLDNGRDIRIRFVNGDSSYWIDAGPLGDGIEERFDKVKPN